MPPRRTKDRSAPLRIRRAMRAPSGFVLAGVGALGALGLGLGLPGIAIFAAAGWSARVAASAIPRPSEAAAIDPFALQDPWRSFVFEARKSSRRFDEAADRLRPGPLRERMELLGERIETTVGDVWRIAQAGQSLSTARKAIDTTTLTDQVAAIESDGNQGDDANASTQRTREALEAQLSSAQRLDASIDTSTDQLRLLDARLKEAVTSAIELSAQGPDSVELAGLNTSIEVLIHELESIRGALDEPAPLHLDPTGRDSTGLDPTASRAPDPDRAPPPDPGAPSEGVVGDGDDGDDDAGTTATSGSS